MAVHGWYYAGLRYGLLRYARKDGVGSQRGRLSLRGRRPWQSTVGIALVCAMDCFATLAKTGWVRKEGVCLCEAVGRGSPLLVLRWSAGMDCFAALAKTGWVRKEGVCLCEAAGRGSPRLALCWSAGVDCFATLAKTGGRLAKTVLRSQWWPRMQ